MRPLYFCFLLLAYSSIATDALDPANLVNGKNETIIIKLTQHPSPAIKGQQVVLECSVDNVDPSEHLTYHWFRDGHQLYSVNTSTWIIKAASLNIRRNISCSVTNHERTSNVASISTKIVAAPAFIRVPNIYVGALQSKLYATLTCRIECSSLCSILWYRNGQVINSSSVHNITVREYPEDYQLNDFESVESDLRIFLSNLRRGVLYTYSCASVSSQSYGPDVKTSAHLSLEYPPEDLNVSTSYVSGHEDSTPTPVKCSGKGNPSLSYVWKKAPNDEIIANGDTLAFTKLLKSDAGVYTCEGHNKHGRKTTTVHVDVPNYKPVCSISFAFGYEGEKALVCTIDANTPTIAVTWTSNSTTGLVETLQSDVLKSNQKSYFFYNSSADWSKRYMCYASNDVGEGTPCETFLPIFPSEVSINYNPFPVLKSSKVTFECKVGKPGFPTNLTYAWLENRKQVYESTSPEWVLPISLKHRNSTFTCLTTNKAGYGRSKEIKLNIAAPPVFLETPNSITKVFYTSKNFSLNCRIECYPLCSIVWLRNGERLDLERSKLYYVTERNIDADLENNLFESIESTLVWDIKNWPGQVLDTGNPVAIYRCAGISSQGNISFATTVFIESPPLNVSVSERRMEIVEHADYKSVVCNVNGHPLNYFWTKSGDDKILSRTRNLLLQQLVRSESGNYTCLVYNKYGNASVDVYVDVLYKPTCQIEYNAANQGLVCSADGNPPSISASLWEISNSRPPTVKTNVFKLNTEDMKKHEYECVVSNKVGQGESCWFSFPQDEI